MLKNKKGKYAIVVVAYNRDKSLKRLLESIARAEYDQDEVDIVISIDKSDNAQVFRVAEEFEWLHGEKEIIKHPTNLGLKKHIMSCGKYTEVYRAIAVLEDDLIVSPSFYLYMKSTVEYYEDNMDIAGISLYSHQWNVEANAPFWPEIRDCDVFFMQYAQSWGQVWLERQWKDFQQWYMNNENVFERKEETYFPQGIKSWGKNSWLKYHIRYCVDNNKYFVYSYASLTTNFTEAGTHASAELTRFQIPLLNDVKRTYKLCCIDEKALRYDVFFENECLKDKMAETYSDIVIDLYGKKPIREKERYRLSSQILNHKIIKAYGVSLRPIEANIYNDVWGNVVFLYDMSETENNKKSPQMQTVQMWNYHAKERYMELREIMPVSISKLKNMLKIMFCK